MKKFMAFLLFLLALAPEVMAERPKVGVVLSGGGAKGVAHIGALKVIEEAGIPIDMVVGTSMGSIIGGLYAVGYTPQQLDSIVGALDWMNLFSDKSHRSDLTISQKAMFDKYLISIPFNIGDFKSVFTGVLKGDNLETLFYELTKEYADSMSFNDLPIPYACVATDVNTNEEKVFHSGLLYKSMRASMAIPTAFSPERIDGRLYVDGGVKNNFPVDVAKAMGADIIIGVNVEDMNFDEPDEAGAENVSAVAVLFKMVMGQGKEKYLKNVEMTDVYIPVDMEGFSPASFGKTALDSIMQRGYTSSEKHMDELLALKKRLGMAEDEKATYHSALKLPSDSLSGKVYSVDFQGFNSRETKWLHRNVRLKEGHKYTSEDLHKAMDKLSRTHPKSKIDVVLRDTLDGFAAEFVRSESYSNRLNLGMNVNTEQIATIVASADFAVNTPCPSMFTVSANFGRYNGIFGEYSFKPYAYGSLDFKIGAEYNMPDTYFQGRRFCSIAFFRPSFRFQFSDQSFASNDLQLKAGFDIEYYRYVDTLYRYTEKIDDYEIESDFFVNYFLGLAYDSFDRAYFPKRGTQLDFMVDVYTDNTYAFQEGLPIFSISAYWQSVFRLSKRLSLIPSLFARHVIADGETAVPLSYANMIGGYTRGRYFDTQMPLECVSHLEVYQLHKILNGASLTFREQFIKNHYLYLTGNFAVLGRNYNHLPFEVMVYGGAIRYAYDSILGPISLSLAYSNTSKFGFYIHVGFMF